jgi:hypothetical protein
LKPVIFSLILSALIGTWGIVDADDSANGESWIGKPQNEWPQITMVNQIEYIDQSHPIAGCSFLLDTGDDTLAVTAKHILTYFKSETMNSVSFANTLRSWKMFPKNSPTDVVIVDGLLNENREEPIDRVPSRVDWLLFSIKEKSENIQPLEFRTDPLVSDEKVYIVGWRYSDKDCAQRIYEGRLVETDDGSVLISTVVLADNTMPGLSGAPVIDSGGRVIGLMSQKAGKMERLSSIDYPQQVLRQKTSAGSSPDKE